MSDNVDISERALICVGFAIVFVLLWMVLDAVFAPVKAGEMTLRFVPVVPTVPGIEASPSPAPHYQRGPVVRTAPSATIIELSQPAPGNRCPRPAFEVISGPKAQRGCYGGP